MAKANGTRVEYRPAANGSWNVYVNGKYHRTVYSLKAAAISVARDFLVECYGREFNGPAKFTENNFFRFITIDGHRVSIDNSGNVGLRG